MKARIATGEDRLRPNLPQLKSFPQDIPETLLLSGGIRKLNQFRSVPQAIPTKAQWPSVQLCQWMENASANLEWHECTGLPITTSASPRRRDTTYITSLRSGWFDYASEEVANNSIAVWGIRSAGFLARMLGIDNIILIGNAPVSTNIWTEQHSREAPLLCKQMASSHQKHFIGVRNLQACKHSAFIDELKKQNFFALPARIVYEFDYREKMEKKHSHLQRDRSALKRSNLIHPH